MTEIPGTDRTAGVVALHPIAGKPGQWTRTEVPREPVPFEPLLVEARKDYVDRGRETLDWPATMRVGLTVFGLPSDAGSLELHAGGSEVTWTDGTRGTLRGIDYQVGPAKVMSLGVLTSSPPSGAAIKQLRFAFDVHQVTRVVRWEASIGLGDAATFAFAGMQATWSVLADGHVIEDAGPRQDLEELPVAVRSPGWSPVVRIVDAKGRDLQVTGGTGLGPTMVTSWEPLTPPEPGPVRVTVDVPLVWRTTRVVALLENLPLQE